MFSSVFALKKGESKFTVTASDDQLITSVNFIATGGIVEDVRQVRIDGIKSIPASDPTITAVPEPSMAILGFAASDSLISAAQQRCCASCSLITSPIRICRETAFGWSFCRATTEPAQASAAPPSARY